MKVDVILPVYKGGRWVNEAIQSIISQTYKNWHLTVIDDACPEDSYRILKNIVYRHPNRISLIKLTTNHGAVAARMKAIRQTSGDVIACIDQDDRWLPNKLEKQVQRLNAMPNVQAVHTDVLHIDDAGVEIKGSADKENKIRGAIPFDQLSPISLSKIIFIKNPIRLSASAFLRSAFEEAGGYDDNIPFGGEEFDLWIKFSSRFKIGHIKEKLVERRIHHMNTSSVFSYPRAIGELKTLDHLLFRYPYLLPIADKRRSMLYRSLVRIGIAADQPNISRYYVRCLVRLNPFHIGSYLRMAMAYSNKINKIVMTLYANLAKTGLLR